MSSKTLAQLGSNEIKSKLQSKRILVVGGTAGIGKELAKSCLKRGAKVTIVGRRQPDSDLSAAKFVQKDLSSMRNAVELAKEVEAESLDAIVFTNGIFAAPERQVSSEGIELDLAVSYLSRFAFAEEVAKNGLGTKRSSSSDDSAKPRIFVMGFPGGNVKANLDDFNAEKKYSVMPVHMNTVVANEQLVDHLNTAFNGTVNVYGLNPGLIKTEIRNNLLGEGSWKSQIAETIIGWIYPTAEAYSESTLINALVSPELEHLPGALIDPKGKILKANEYLSTEGVRGRIVEESKKLLARALAKKEASL